MIHKIARREGLGNLLADGVKRAAAKIGRGSERFAVHVKGQEFPMHEPRGKRSLALAYALSPLVLITWKQFTTLPLRGLALLTAV